LPAEYVNYVKTHLPVIQAESKSALTRSGNPGDPFGIQAVLTRLTTAVTGRQASERRDRACNAAQQNWMLSNHVRQRSR